MLQQQCSFASGICNAALPAEAVQQLSQQKQQCSFAADAATAAKSRAAALFIDTTVSPLRLLGPTVETFSVLFLLWNISMYVFLVLKKYNR
jgi:hypothetical protein